ncbi:MAG: terminase family protein [Phycisphaeraceae bacterium]|nr:terminase family protein [Phycisphaeraceae bacterium]
MLHDTALGVDSPDRFAQMISGRRWRPLMYQRILGRKIGGLLLAGGGRLIVNAPPRHGKSEMTTFWTPAWFLSREPKRRVIISAYGAELASGKFGRDLRNFFAAFGHVDMPRRKGLSAHRWHTAAGGGVLAVGVGGPITGFGADLLILDDPVKNWEEARSARKRERLIEWFMTTFYTRGEPNASIVVTMTRWHEDDLTNWLLTRHGDPWELMRLPALADGDDMIGRPIGAALAPSRYGTGALLAMRHAMGEAGTWQAMFQQQPVHTSAARVYENFGNHNVDPKLELDINLPLHLSLDFNIVPGMHGCVGQFDTDAQRFTVRHVLFGQGLTVRGLLDQLAQWLGPRRPGLDRTGFPVLEVFGDAAGNQRWAGTSESCYHLIGQWMHHHGWPHRLRVPARNPPIRERVDAMNAALKDLDGQVRYLIHPTCKPLLADLAELTWDLSGRPAKSDVLRSHASDAESYRVWCLRPIRTGRPSAGKVDF